MFVEVLEKKWECKGAVHQLLVGHTKACDSVRREVLFNILIYHENVLKLIK
jgi:hypothetical protein